MARMTPKEGTAVNVLLGYFAGRAVGLPVKNMEAPCPGEIGQCLQTTSENDTHSEIVDAAWEDISPTALPSLRTARCLFCPF